MAQQRRGSVGSPLERISPAGLLSVHTASQQVCSWHWKQAAMPKQEEIDKCAAVAAVPVTGTRLNSEQGSDAIRRRSSPNLVLPSTPSHFTENKFNTTPHGRLAASGDGWVQTSAGIFCPSASSAHRNNTWDLRGCTPTRTAEELNKCNKRDKCSPWSLQSCHKIPDVQNALIKMQIKRELSPTN